MIDSAMLFGLVFVQHLRGKWTDQTMRMPLVLSNNGCVSHLLSEMQREARF